MGLEYQAGSDLETVKTEMLMLGNGFLQDLKNAKKSKDALTEYIDNAIVDGIINDDMLHELSKNDERFKIIDRGVKNILNELDEY